MGENIDRCMHCAYGLVCGCIGSSVAMVLNVPVGEPVFFARRNDRRMADVKLGRESQVAIIPAHPESCPVASKLTNISTGSYIFTHIC